MERRVKEERREMGKGEKRGRGKEGEGGGEEGKEGGGEGERRGREGERKGRQRGGEGERKMERKMEGEECEWIRPCYGLPTSPWLPVRPFNMANGKEEEVPVYKWVSSLSDRVLM